MRALALVALLLAACATPDEALVVSAEQLEDRLVVRVAGEVFTEYRFASSQKYPYFFPVNGPRSGRSLTTETAEPYPHHHSLFFACDRVNGGNYWQEGLDRGRIAHEGLRVERSIGQQVVFVARSLWQRPGAPAPFRDERRVTISAPRADLRLLDIAITWTALERVRIRRTNHALFAARVASELAPDGGGTLVDATGAQNEKATFGNTAPWIDCAGRTTPEHLEGLAILVHPDNPWTPTPWFTRDYGFFSPTPMHWLPKEGLDLAAGTRLVLRYLVVVHAGTAADAGIAGIHARWCVR